MSAILWEQSAGLFARTLTGFGLNWLVQSTILLCAGLSIARLMRRHGSAAQSVVYRTTLVAVLICPMLTWSLSLAGITGWTFGIPANWKAVPTDLAAGPQRDPRTLNAVAKSNRAHQFDTRPNMTDSRADAFDTTRIGDDRITTGGFVSTPRVPNQVSTNSMDLEARNPREVEGSSQNSVSMVHRFAIVLSLLWIGLATWMFVRLSIAWRRLAGIRRRAALADSEVIRVCLTFAAKLGVNPPDVRQTPFLPSPCLAGLRNPVVLLPEESLTLALDDVIIHELAHLLRKDCHWNLLRNLAVTIFWFHPLLWVLSRKLEMAAEEVCDDFVVKFGGNREDYAYRLVDVAEFSSAPIAKAGVAIVSLRSMLAHRVARIMDYSRQLSTGVSRTLLICTLAGGLVGTIIIGFVGAAPTQQKAEEKSQEKPIVEKSIDEPPTDKEATARQPTTVAATDPAANDGGTKPKLKSKEINGDTYTVRGRVLKPDGQPAAGARVTASRFYWTNRVPQRGVAATVAGEDGQFEISYHNSQFDDNVGSGAINVSIVAHADGYGVAGVNSYDINESSELILKLVPDSSIRGRITDLEGRPIEGVNVTLLKVNTWYDGKGLDKWLEQLKSGTGLKRAESGFHTSDDNRRTFTTDKDGRFTLKGIGPERVASIELRGDTIAYRQIEVVTHAMEPLSAHPWTGSSQKELLFGNDFTYQALPTRVIEGTIRDAKTALPLAGVTVVSKHLAGTTVYPNDILWTQTDSDGRYRLVGMPKSDGSDPNDLNVITIRSNSGTPYLLREITIPSAPGIAPTKLDIELHRGIWITGRVTDKVTGKPVRARIRYLPFLDNPFTRGLPEFHDDNMDGEQSDHMTDADGRYRVPGIPGRSIVGANSLAGLYRSAVGAEKIDGLTKDRRFLTYNVEVHTAIDFFNVLSEINPTENDQSVTCDLVLDPGGTIRLTIVDPDGKPVDGCVVKGRFPGTFYESQPSTIEVGCLSPNETRTLMVTHHKRKLGKVFEFTFDEQKSDPITLTLEPTATVKGRFVDRDGLPIKFVEIDAHANCKTRLFGSRMGFYSKADGTFACFGLPAGCESYSFYTQGGEMKGGSRFGANTVVQSGQTIDLGDVVLTPDN